MTESVPVLWPHIREVAAAIRPAAPIGIIPTAGSGSIAKRGAWRHPAWTHFPPDKGKKSSRRKKVCITYSLGFPESLMRAEREQRVKTWTLITWAKAERQKVMLHKVGTNISKRCSGKTDLCYMLSYTFLYYSEVCFLKLTHHSQVSLPPLPDTPQLWLKAAISNQTWACVAAGLFIVGLQIGTRAHPKLVCGPFYLKKQYARAKIKELML